MQTSELFAEVAVDIPNREVAERLFSYRIPEHLRREVFVGSHVLVPFGKQKLIPAFVVSVTEERPRIETRDIEEVLEKEPLFDRRYIEFLYWIADYYCCSITQVIAAAVPAGMGGRIRRVLRLAESAGSGPAPGAEEALILHRLRESSSGTLALSVVRQRSGLSQSRFFTALTRLRQSGFVEVADEAPTRPQPKTVQSVVLSNAAAATARQQEVVSCLRRHAGQMPVRELIKVAGTTSGTIKRMVERGVLAYVSEEIVRNPLSGNGGSALGGSPPPALTGAQAAVVDRLSAELTAIVSAERQPDGEPWLLHGVTGSGKTEVYLQLIKQALALGRAALMLVPEISLTPQLSQRLLSRFGQSVAIWHSALSEGERYDTWRRIRSGQVRVLIGARSAILAFMPEVGLIILDEEHDSSYKQASPSPRYSARRLAEERARRERALLLLGSATPDVSTYQRARLSQRLLELPQRVFSQPMPETVVVDMRKELDQGNRTLFSRALTAAVKAALGRGEQCILLMNRRGFASHVFCRACGHVERCRNCSVSLVFHNSSADAGGAGSGGQTGGLVYRSGGERRLSHRLLESGYLSCHHCGYGRPNPDSCPSCKSPFLKPFGLGTQRVEMDAGSTFPGARLLRLDSDVARRKGAYQQVFEDFAAGRADILIGTQMVAKGLDIPRVTVVGVLAADVAFNLPDYRSVERGFQLLTQVAGRAGRSHHPGKVVLQTYSPDFPALTLARNHDYTGFFEQEIAARREFSYPPFSQIIRVVVASGDRDSAEAACDELAEAFSVFVEDRLPPDSLSLTGPAPCLIERLRGQHRLHFILKNRAGEEGRKVAAEFLRPLRGTNGISISVDVDALDLS